MNPLLQDLRYALRALTRAARRAARVDPIVALRSE